MLRFVAFTLIALFSLPASQFLAGVYQEIGFESATSLGVMWGFFWIALWIAMHPPVRPS